MITIVDYGLGNLKSIQNMLKKLGYDSEITSSIEKIAKSNKIILPGVGSFDTAMININELGLLNILNKKANSDKVPFLGICLGMQIMCKESEEGMMNGLSWIDAKVKRFQFERNHLKVPHMGWNTVVPSKQSSIFNSNSRLRFYHVHSYYVELKDSSQEIAYTNYGFPFTTSFQKENIYGVQFHPEKSHKFGFELLNYFAKL
tara:strand:- start:2400 stop:3005 length:606 start_codon:yes stop_codon:yes gene_type:complete